MVFGWSTASRKTTLAKNVVSASFTAGHYLDWDYDEDRQDILQKRWSAENNLLVFDELHKFPRWKAWLKGVSDVSQENTLF
jgi:predicted AAA+ superfamily ATPase